MVARPKSVIRGFPKLSTIMFDYDYLHQSGYTGASDHTYPFEVSMNHPTCVEISKTLSDPKQLRGGVRHYVEINKNLRTRVKRFVSRLFLTCSRRSPPGIHSETS